MVKKYQENKRNRPYLRSIWLNENELNNWDSKKIHSFLQGESPNTMEDIELLKKMILAFIKNEIEIELNENEIRRVKELHAKI